VILVLMAGDVRTLAMFHL